MFTNQFKTVVAGIVLVLVGGGLAINQAQLSKQVANLEDQNKMRVVTVSPTPVIVEVPTATPTATLRYIPVVKPTPVVSKPVQL